MSKHNNLIVAAHNADIEYTIQEDATSGDTYALRFDGEIITHISGPLSHHDVRLIHDGMFMIYELPFESITGFFHNPEGVNWQAPHYTYKTERDRFTSTGWNRCAYCESPTYQRTTCHLCQYLMDGDTEALATIGEWMRTVHMEPHAAAYSLSRDREKAAYELHREEPDPDPDYPWDDIPTLEEMEAAYADSYPYPVVN